MTGKKLKMIEQVVEVMTCDICGEEVHVVGYGLAESSTIHLKCASDSCSNYDLCYKCSKAVDIFLTDRKNIKKNNKQGDLFHE